MYVTLEEAALLLKSGHVVALPTETVYGLAASLQSEAAINEIFRLKKRPQDNPLIVHVASLEQLEQITECDLFQIEQLTSLFWPGPLTLVLPANKKNVPSNVRAGLSTVGVRMPAHPLTLALLHEVGPIVAPSANLSGRPSSTTAAHVLEDFGPQLPVLDGGSCEKGVESTILIQLEEGGYQLGRLGAISIEALEACLGHPIEQKPNTKILCPGSHYRHYAPRAQLLFRKGPYLGEPPVVLGFSDQTYVGAERVYYLGRQDEPALVQQRLYSTLRQLDQDGVKQVWVDANFDPHGPLRTVFERLSRAAESSH